MYDKDGNLITEINDNGQNMGTYNYASSSKDSGTHNEFDVYTYKKWGNTPLDPPPVEKSWNKNVTEKTLYDLIGTNEPRIKGSGGLGKIDIDAKNHYIKICEKIGINYYKLLEKNFSDACY